MVTSIVEDGMSSNSANDGDLVAILREYIRSYIRNELDDMLPARVTKYDSSTNRVEVQPLVMVGTTSGEKVSRAKVSSVPVLRIGGGGFFVRFPIKVGDFGWLKATDRDISLVLQNGGQEDWPNTERLHSFSDALFIPDTLKDWSVDDSFADAVVFQSLDGGSTIAIADSKITVRGSDIILDGDVTVSGSLSVSGSSLKHKGTDVGDSHWHGYIDSTGQGATPVPSHTAAPQTEST